MTRTRPNEQAVEDARIREAREQRQAERYAEDDGRAWGILARRSGASMFGAAQAWLKEGGVEWTGTKGEAARKADELNARPYSSVNVSYAPMAREV